MKALIFTLALLGVAFHSVSAAAVDDTVLLTLNSTKYCVGTSWDLRISKAPPNATIRLKGSSNNRVWEILQWAKTDASGNFSTSGPFAPNATGKHTLRVEIAASTSNILPLEVVNCGWRNTGSMNAAHASDVILL